MKKKNTDKRNGTPMSKRKNIRLKSVPIEAKITIIIEYLNKRADKKFRPTSKGSIALITKLIDKGFSVGDSQKVIDCKVSEWLGKPTVDEYLRPSTLFDLYNFKKYLSQAYRNERSNHDNHKTQIS